MGSKDSEDKPRGVLPGIAKSFLGLPSRRILDPEEQGTVATIRGNELTRRQSAIIEREGDRSSQTANRALVEIQAMRAATESGARALQDSQWTAREASGRLNEITTTLQDGLPAIANGIGELTSVTRQMAGSPAKPKSIEEIVRANPGTESEIIILAIDGGLKTEQRDKLFDSLPAWKRDIIDSGLVYRNDPGMEKKLRPQEKVFLAELRRKAGASIKTFSSIKVLARHDVLDEDLHFDLSETVPEARTGIVGVVHGVNQIERQGDVRIEQGNILNKLQHAGLLIQSAGLEETTKMRAGVDTLVGIEGQALVEHRAIRASSQMTAENTLVIARGVAAQVYLARRAEQHRERQIEVSEGIERNTGLLTVFAERGNQLLKRGNEIAGANLAVSVKIAGDTGRLVEIGEDSLECLGSIADSSAQTAMNTTSMARDVGSLVGFAERAEYANAIMISQGRTQNLLLGDMADSLDTANYYHALTREELAAVHLTLIQGIEAAAERDILKISASLRANDLLSTLIEMARSGTIEIRETLEGLDRNMQARHLSENRARAEERFQEGFGKYKKGKVTEAIALFTESIKHWSNDQRVYFYRGLCYVLTDRPKKAEDDFNEALTWAEDTKNPEILAVIKMNLARLYYSESKVHAGNGNVEISDEKMLAAILTAKEACGVAPDFHVASFALATYLAAFKLYDDAREILMKILPKDPELVQKMQYVEEFIPILDSFKHVFSESGDGEADDEMKDKLSVAVMKDCMEIGDFSTVIYCVEELMKSGSVHLLRLKIWEIEGLKPIRKQIIGVIIKATDSVGQSGDSQNCYGIAILALLYREDEGEISNSKVFDVFLAGTQNDLDVTAKNKTAMLKKLRSMSESATDIILAINKLHRRGLPWLG